MKLLSQIKFDVNKNSNKALTSEITDKTQELQLLKEQQDNTGPNKRKPEIYFNSVELNCFKRNSKKEKKVKAKGKFDSVRQ